MALIKLSSIGITNLSGKAGGSVYARNRGGNYIRNFAMPSNPKTVAQMAARSAFGNLSSQWRSLASDLQNAWNEAAPNFPYKNRFGDQKVLSGFGLFQSLNRNLQVVGISMLSSPPEPIGVETLLSVSVAVENTAGVLSAVISATPTSAPPGNTQIAIYATPPVGSGVRYAENKLRFIDSVATASINNYDISEAYENLFGVPAVGANVQFAFDPISSISGERGARLTTVSSVVAGE